jgi:hypothetical protein
MRSTGSGLDEWGTSAEAVPLMVISQLVRAGLTTTLAIGAVTGLATEELELAMTGKLVPAFRQREALRQLLTNYELAIRLVNAATMKQELDGM